MLTPRHLCALLIACALLPCAAAPAASDPTGPGTPDRTYGHDGLVRSSLGAGPTAEEPLLRSLVRGDGRVVVASESRRVSRFTAGGAFDRRFGFAGAFEPDFEGDGNDSLRDVAVAADGRIVLVGTSRADRVTVLRLTADGRTDPTFNHGAPLVIPTDGFIWGGYRSGGEAVAIGPDGGIFIAYSVRAAYTYPPAEPTVPRTVVTALAPDGTLRDDFGSGGSTVIVPPLDIAGMVRLASGALRLVATGEWPEHGLILAGLDAGGRPEPAFGADGVRRLGAPLTPSAVTLDAGDHLLVSGAVDETRPVLARLKADGDADPAFGDGGVVTLSARAAGSAPGPVAVGPAGRIAVPLTTDAAQPTASSPATVRHVAVELLTAAGRPVRSFGREGFVRLPGPNRKAPAVGVGAGFAARDRLIVTGTTGDGLSSIRDDYGPDAVVLARLRLRAARLRIGATWRVDASRVATAPARCARGGATCAGTVVLGARRVSFRVAAGRRATLRVRVGRGRLPRHATARVTLRRAGGGPVLDAYKLTLRLTRRR